MSASLEVDLLRRYIRCQLLAHGADDRQAVAQHDPELKPLVVSISEKLTEGLRDPELYASYQRIVARHKS